MARLDQTQDIAYATPERRVGGGARRDHGTPVGVSCDWLEQDTVFLAEVPVNRGGARLFRAEMLRDHEEGPDLTSVA